MHAVRLKRHLEDQKKIENWKWSDDSVAGSRELNGLKVMMALINNWDLKDENNELYGGKNAAEQVYIVSDLGASFGTTGHNVSAQPFQGRPRCLRPLQVHRQDFTRVCGFLYPQPAGLDLCFWASGFCAAGAAGRHCPPHSSRGRPMDWTSTIQALFGPNSGCVPRRRIRPKPGRRVQRRGTRSNRGAESLIAYNLPDGLRAGSSERGRSACVDELGSIGFDVVLDCLLEPAHAHGLGLGKRTIVVPMIMLDAITGDNASGAVRATMAMNEDGSG